MMSVDVDILECLYLARQVREVLTDVRKTDSLALVRDAVHGIDSRLTEIAQRRFFSVGRTSLEADEAKWELLHGERK